MVGDRIPLDVQQPGGKLGVAQAAEQLGGELAKDVLDGIADVLDGIPDVLGGTLGVLEQQLGGVQLLVVHAQVLSVIVHH